MLNIRFLYILLDSKYIRAYLGLAAAIGIGVLADVLIILKLSLLIGPWITMAILAGNTALGIRIAYGLMERRANSIKDSVDRGRCDHEIFSRYLMDLAASLFLIIPGLLNSIIGSMLLLPGISVRMGTRISRILGIDWQEAYEYLRLERITEGSRSDAGE